MRSRLTILWLGLVVLSGPVRAQAQSFTIQGGGAATLKAAPDWAATDMGDPWDFEQRTDYVYMFSDDLATGSSGFASVPDVSDGLLKGVFRTGTLGLTLHFEGVQGAFNLASKNGIRYPIDANTYRRLSLRMKRGRVIGGVTEENRVAAQWFAPFRANGGGKHGYAVGTNGVEPYANQSPIADQAKDTYHIYTLDLDGTTSGMPWQGQVAGLILQLSTTAQMQGAPIELDWVRLTPRGQAVANLQWGGFGGRVTLTAANSETGDVVQVYPGPAGAQEFPSSGTFAWDYGFLPGGTWVLTARAGGQTRTTTLTIDAAPVLTITDPDSSGGRDFATTLLADAWDLTNPQDVTRFGRLFEIPVAAFTELGLDGVTDGRDPFVQFTGQVPGTLKIPADTYHRLTFTYMQDHPELMAKDVFNPLGPDPCDNPWEGGHVMRIVWNRAEGTPSQFRVSQDIVHFDGFAQTYSLDLSALDDPETEVEAGGGPLWPGGDMSILRIDLNESNCAQRAFRLANVKLAADDEPNGNGFFLIRWQVSDATGSRQFANSGGSDATIAFYYDTDLQPGGGVAIASGIAASAGQYAWDVSSLQPGVPYYVYAVISDGAGNTQARYSTGPVKLPSAYPAGFRTDSNGNGLPDQWEATHVVSSASEDADGDGLTNIQEYQTGTSPRISNVWNLSEGATGFFVQRLALANPDAAPAEISVKYLRPAGRAPVTRTYSVLPFGRLTINVNDIAGLQQEDVSAVVTAISGGVLAERTMFWGDLFYGGHTGKAIQEARTQWYLAEGAANSLFSTFILLANATNNAAQVTLTFLREGNTPHAINVTVEPNSRLTIPTNSIPELNPASFATQISSSVPISVERSMYINTNPDKVFEGGHESAAVAEAKTEWYVAEGQASDFFSMYVLLANPGSVSSTVTLRYLMPGRTPTSKVVTLGPQSRFTIDISNPDHAPEVSNTDVSVEVRATSPIVVERAMYWPKNGVRWTDGHNSAGLTATGVTWAMAEGEFGGSRQFQSYVLFANPSGADAQVRMTLLREGGLPPLALDFVVPANQRLTRSAGDFVGLGLQSGEKFGVSATSLNGVPIVIERAMYWNGGGEFWGAGTNETGFRLR